MAVDSFISGAHSATRKLEAHAARRELASEVLHRHRRDVALEERLQRAPRGDDVAGERRPIRVDEALARSAGELGSVGDEWRRRGLGAGRLALRSVCRASARAVGAQAQARARRAFRSVIARAHHVDGPGAERRHLRVVLGEHDALRRAFVHGAERVTELVQEHRRCAMPAQALLEIATLLLGQLVERLLDGVMPLRAARRAHEEMLSDERASPTSWKERVARGSVPTKPDHPVDVVAGVRGAQRVEGLRDVVLVDHRPRPRVDAARDGARAPAR